MREKISTELLNEMKQIEASMNISAGAFDLDSFTSKLEEVIDKTEQILGELINEKEN
jgi:hypothetical protein